MGLSQVLISPTFTNSSQFKANATVIKFHSSLPKHNFFELFPFLRPVSILKGFLVSKETVVLRQWDSETKKLVLSNEFIKVE